MTDIILKQGTGVPSDSDLEVAEVAIDTSSGAMYTKLADGSVEHLNPVSTDGGGGSAVHIGELPPASPEEGQQWMEVPASGDATMWVYDGDKWLQHPSGKDGAPGADGNIADATEQGVIATWDDTAKQWTPEGAVVVDANGNANFSGNVNCNNVAMGSSGATVSSGPAGSVKSSIQLFGEDAGSNQNTMRFYTNSIERMRIDTNGRVDITGSLYVNGNPKIGTAELIETLSTLREATKDETTLEGLRDAIGNAVGGLIEKFEAMQSPVTQEISDE